MYLFYSTTSLTLKLLINHRYTREFNLDKNTHLIAEVAQGAKFELAASSSSIRIVKPLWLAACAKSGKRLDETPYLLTKGDAINAPRATTQQSSLINQLDEILSRPLEIRPIFECHIFYLLGFDEDTPMKQKLGKLIRRGQGTIYWEMNEEISIIIIHDSCEDTLR